ncbi:MAG: PAS domain S-box protein [Promethearchaeota archaeon]
MGKKNIDKGLFQQKIQQLINNLDIIYFKGELKGKLLMHNTALNRILGLAPSIDLTGSFASQFFSDDEVQKKYYEELEENGFVKDLIVKVKKSDGNIIYMQINSHLIKDPDEKNILIEGTAADITEKYFLEQNLKETERQYKIISNNVNDLIAILNKDLKHEHINNNAYFNVLGYTKDEVIGKLIRDFVHPEDIMKISKATKEGLIRGVMLEEYRIKHKDGHYIWVESKGSFLKENDEITGAIFISRDITDKKEAEQRIKESENKYRTLFESSTDGIYSTDMEGKFIEFNEAFLKMLGYLREELLVKNTRQITPSKWYEIDDEITFTQLSDEQSKIYEKELIRKDGSTIPVSVRFWILQDEQSDPYRIWAIVRDITERKQMENELKEINRIKSEFLRRSSHELKTPLVSIKGFSELILSKYSEDLSPSIISNLEEINKGCERLQGIINNLLQTSKLESTEFKPKFEIEDLTFLINYCIEELHPFVAMREHSINVEIPDRIITKFEKEEIHEVITNLLTNSIKYTPPKGWIDVKAEITKDCVIVSIKDNGIGFTEEEKKKIFQQFGKVERYGQGLDLGIDGSGLGLYISKKIVEAHGGKIWMESQGKNKGSTFYFSLPII